MPIVIPTPEELANMSWHQRRQATHRSDVAIESLRTLYREPPAGPDYGLLVRQQARDLLSLMQPDPDAAEHRAALLHGTQKSMNKT
jgi:hypothetical protein